MAHLFRGVYLYLIFEMSIWEFITNIKKIDFKPNLIFFSSSNLIFTACVACKNQVWTQQKIEFVSKLIFFRVYNKLPNWYFKNQVQIDTALVLNTSILVYYTIVVTPLDFYQCPTPLPFPDLHAALGKYSLSYHTDFHWRSSDSAKEWINKFLQNGIRSK